MNIPLTYTKRNIGNFKYFVGENPPSRKEPNISKNEALLIFYSLKIYFIKKLKKTTLETVTEIIKLIGFTTL